MVCLRREAEAGARSGRQLANMPGMHRAGHVWRGQAQPITASLTLLSALRNGVLVMTNGSAQLPLPAAAPDGGGGEGTGLGGGGDGERAGEGEGEGEGEGVAPPPAPGDRLRRRRGGL